MAQSNALREQPSMDEILASIRRIIDAGESQANTSARKPGDDARTVVEATVPPPAANDEGADRPRTPKAELTQAPATVRVAPPEASPAIAAAVSDYLETERAKTAAEPVVEAPMVKAPVIETKAPAVEAYEPDIASSPVLDTLPEPDISEVEAALRAEFGPVDRNMLSAERRAKYDARFTEADNGAFRQVGSLLRGKVEDVVAPPRFRPAREFACFRCRVAKRVAFLYKLVRDVLRERRRGSRGDRRGHAPADAAGMARQQSPVAGRALGTRGDRADRPGRTALGLMPAATLLTGAHGSGLDGR